MKGFEASDDLDEDIPDLLLLYVRLSLLVRANLLKDITVVSVLHYETKANKIKNHRILKLTIRNYWARR